MEEKMVMINKEQSNLYKGIALIFVIVSHLPRIFPGVNLSVLHPLGFLGVSIFLFLSGYGLQRSYCKNRLALFWRKRIIKIVPTAAVVTIGIVIICYVTGVKSFSLIEIILSCLGLSNAVNSVTWYLGMMWFCYFVFWASKKIGLNPYWGGAILSGGILILSIVFGNTSINMWGLNIFSFSLGMIFAENRIIGKWIQTKRGLLISFFTFIMLFVLYYIVLGNSDVLIFRNPVKSILSALFLICFISFMRSLYKHSIFKL